MRTIYVFLILLMVQLLFAQNKRIVLLEEATNASCGPCATYNPGFQKFVTSHLGGVLSVRYHAWWPGSNDPMYTANTTDNRNRINYYGINGVPGYAIDGHFYGVPSNPELMERQMYERLSKAAPVRIQLSSEFKEDSIAVSVELEALEDVADTTLHLRVALIERLISYSSAPGSNGEKDFGDVMRQLLPTADGSKVEALQAGDLLTLQFKTAVRNSWNWEDMSAIAWLQSDATKEILQAQIDFPTSIIESDLPDLDLLSANSAMHKPFRIVNHNADTAHVRVRLDNVSVTAGWTYTLEQYGAEMSELEAEILPGDSLLFQLKITTTDRGSIQADIFAENLDDPGFYGEGYGYGFTRLYQGVIPENNDVLLVDDDGGTDYQAGFESILNELNIHYLTVPQAEIDTFRKQIDLTQYKLVIWNVSWGFPTFIPSDIDILKAYLDAGGSLLLMGQDIGWDIFDNKEGSSHFPEAQDFYQNYLGASYVEDYAGSGSMTGTAGDPIGDDMSFPLSNPYGYGNFYPDAIASYQNKGQVVLNFSNGKVGGLRYDSGTFRTVYTSVGLEQISGSDNRTKFLNRVLAWTANLTGWGTNSQTLPFTVELQQNYPNPFNPVTTIRFQIPNSQFVTLNIYDNLGQKGTTLVSGKQKAGMHEVQWDATGMASGIYYYRLETEQGIVQTRKLVLLK